MSIDVMYSDKLNLKNIKIGMYLSDSTTHPKLWYIDEKLIEQMKEYEDTTNKSAIKNNKITGMFLDFKYHKDNPEA